MKPILIATTNAAKLAEYRLLLRGFDLAPLSIMDVGISAQAPETAATFAANARLKAAFYFVRAGIATLADDGGLEVDALGGAPGVMSHRWLGAIADGIEGDRALAEEVVRRMKGVAAPHRRARIRAAGALVYTEKGMTRESLGEAALEGVIAERCYPAIRPGFPYRAVLYLPEHGRYLAELCEEEEARLSQRRAVVDILASELRRFAAAP